MKKINNITILLLTLFLIISCVDDENFDAPDLTIVDPEIENVTSILAIANQVAASNDPVITFEDNESFVPGFVISSDEAGNFFEEIIIQDKLENPNAGIRILIDVNPLFTKFELGRKIFIKLNGLSAGISNGVLTLGFLDATGDLEKIPEGQLDEFFIKSPEIGTLIPLSMNLECITGTNLFIELDDVQFNRNQVLDGLTFAAESTDSFDGERILEGCAGGSIIFSTSTFADFNSLTLPANRGALQGILTKNFFGDEFNFVINSPTDIKFDNVERCDPIIIDCGLANVEGANTIFADDFETQTEGDPITGNGWTNYIQDGSVFWESYTSGGTNASLGISARIGSFNSGDECSVAWLITPEIDLDLQDNETFTFKTSNSFADGSRLELLFSSDWDGTPENINNAEWLGNIPQATIVSDNDFFGDWIDSGIVDLSCGQGKIYIAFKYLGSGQDDDADGTYELDEINIKF
jgi:hypothetical protein